MAVQQTFISIYESAHIRNLVVIATKGLQDRNTNIIAGTTVENKGKLILRNLTLFGIFAVDNHEIAQIIES